MKWLKNKFRRLGIFNPFIQTIAKDNEDEKKKPLMKFRISRASECDENVKPCGEAYRLDDEWFVDIESLDQLITFAINHGGIIIEPGWKRCSITIYDDYME